MALPIVTETDFTIKPYSIPALNSDTRPHFEDFIRDEMQEFWVKLMLGDTLGQAFIDDLDSQGVPQAQEFIDIYNELIFEYAGSPIIFQGVKRQLIGIFYYIWMSEISKIALHTGTSKVKSIAAVDFAAVPLAAAWNDIAVHNEKLMLYINKNSDSYPDYEYHYFSLNSPI